MQARAQLAEQARAQFADNSAFADIANSNDEQGPDSYSPMEYSRRLREWRSELFRVVCQDSCLMSGTVRENLM